MTRVDSFYGYSVGDDVEVRLRAGHEYGPWQRAKILRFDHADRSPWVQLPGGGASRIINLKMIRRFEVPTDPDDINRWLEEG